MRLFFYMLLSFALFQGETLMAQESTSDSRERALELRKIEMHSTTIPEFIYEDNHQYRCFATRESAIAYFLKETIYKDLEIYYIATSSPVVKGTDDTEMLLFPITND